MFDKYKVYGLKIELWPLQCLCSAIYGQRGAEATLINCLAVTLVLLGVAVGYIVTNPNYQRQPEPEEERLQLANWHQRHLADCMWNMHHLEDCLWNTAYPIAKVVIQSVVIVTVSVWYLLLSVSVAR